MTATARLRQAAEVLRERAEAATPGPWDAHEDDIDPGSIAPAGWTLYSPYAGHDFAGLDEEADATFIATMSPTVALAVADWLGASAAFEEKLNRDGPERDDQRWKPHQWKQALATADAILAGVES